MRDFYTICRNVYFDKKERQEFIEMMLDVEAERIRKEKMKNGEIPMDDTSTPDEARKTLNRHMTPNW